MLSAEVHEAGGSQAVANANLFIRQLRATWEPFLSGTFDVKQGEHEQTYALGPDAEGLRDAAAGVLWLSVLFSGVLAFNRSYQLELDGGALDVDPDAKEAVAFAVLAWAHLRGIPANLPSATGAAGPRVLGSLTPGA